MAVDVRGHGDRARPALRRWVAALLALASMGGLTACDPFAAPAPDRLTPAAESRPFFRPPVPRPDVPVGMPLERNDPLATPTPVPPSPAARTPSARASATTASSNGSAVPRPRQSLTPMACTAYLGSRAHVVVQTVTAPGRVTVSWTHDGAPGITAYRVAARPQPAPSPTWTPRWISVTPPSTCGPVSATITGVSPGTRYLLWLTIRATSQVTGRLTDTTVGETSFTAQ